MKELVLVDFDDTLVDTGPKFQNARRSLLKLMRDIGFGDDIAYDVLYNQVDPGMRALHGLGPRRMEPAFIATYQRLCELHELPADSTIAAQCAELGRSCYGAPPLFAGALDALRRLAGEVPTVIYTQSGDTDYQYECVRDAGVIDVVTAERVRVCPRKDTDMFIDTLRLYGVRDAARAWMVGNSIRSDINPALEAGANAILVETTDPWEYDLADPHTSTFHRVETFPHAVDLLLNGGQPVR